MVNSGSFDAAGSEGESAKAEFTQLEDGDAVLRSAASPRHLAEFAAVVPNAAPAPPNATPAPERDDGLTHQDMTTLNAKCAPAKPKASLQCSVPLDKVKNVLDLCRQSPTQPPDKSKLSNLYILENYLKQKQTIVTPIDTDAPPTPDATTTDLSPSSSRPALKRLLCLFCERTFTSNSLRQKHVDRCHSAGQTRRSSSRTSSHSPSVTACCFCSKLNNTKHTLKQLLEHLVMDHSNRYFACVTCQERFTSMQSLRDHNKSVHNIEEVDSKSPQPLRLHDSSSQDQDVHQTDLKRTSSTDIIKSDSELVSIVAAQNSVTPSTTKQLKRTFSLKSILSEKKKSDEKELETSEKSSELHVDFEESILTNVIKPSDETKPEETTVLRKFTRSSAAKAKKNNNGATKKISVKSTKNGVRSLRTTRATVKQLNNYNKTRKSKLLKNEVADADKIVELKKPKITSNSVFSLVNAYTYKYEKIYDHASDSIKDANSVQFNAVFDKEFYCRTVCNIRDNLMHHLDGKLNRNIESESRISNFEHNPASVPETDAKSTSDSYGNFGCDLSLNAVTPVATLLASSQYGEDFDAQIEYGAKASQKKAKKVAVVKYKFPNKKYNSLFRDRSTHTDLTCLDIWTQFTVKERQHKCHDDDNFDSDSIYFERATSTEAKHQVDELNTILDTRGPFEDLRLEADAAQFFELRKKNFKDGDQLSEEASKDVYFILEDLLNRVMVTCNNEHKIKPETEVNSNANVELNEESLVLPHYLGLQESSDNRNKFEIDKTDKIALICSSQDPNIQPPIKLELTGEWTRPRLYICAACGFKLPNIKLMEEHKNNNHPHIWCSHYEFVGSLSQTYRHLSIPGLGKVGVVEMQPQNRLWQKSDARICTKCTKQCHNLGELHKHILECGGDWTWMLARKKCKYRPYGARSRRRRQRGYKRSCNPEVSRVKPKIKSAFIGPRPKPSKPSDAETIKRMLENLPAKRNRKMISMRDGVQRPRKQLNPPKNTTIKSSNKNFHYKNAPQITKQTLRSALNRKVVINNMRKQKLENNEITAKLRSRVNKENTVTEKDTIKEEDLSTQLMGTKTKIRNKRMISRILGSKIFDSNSALITRRRLVKAITQNNLIRRTRLRTKMFDNAHLESSNDTDKLDKNVDKISEKVIADDNNVKDGKRSSPRNQSNEDASKDKDTKLENVDSKPTNDPETTSKKSNTKRLLSVFGKSNKKPKTSIITTEPPKALTEEKIDTINAVIDEVIGKAIREELPITKDKPIENISESKKSLSKNVTSKNSSDNLDPANKKPEKLGKVIEKSANKIVQNVKSFRNSLKKRKTGKEGIGSKIIRSLSIRKSKAKKKTNDNKTTIEKTEIHDVQTVENEYKKTTTDDQINAIKNNIITDEATLLKEASLKEDVANVTLSEETPRKEDVANLTFSEETPMPIKEDIAEVTSPVIIEEKPSLVLDKTPCLDSIPTNEKLTESNVMEHSVEVKTQSENSTNSLNKLKCKMKRSGRGLNDCIAMLKCKLEQKTNEPPSLVDKSNLFILNSTETNKPIEPVIEKILVNLVEKSSEVLSSVESKATDKVAKESAVSIQDKVDQSLVSPVENSVLKSVLEVPTIINNRKEENTKAVSNTEVSMVEIETQTADEDMAPAIVTDYIPTAIQSSFDLSYVLNATLKNCLLECVKNKCETFKIENQNYSVKARGIVKDRKVGSIRKRRGNKPRPIDKPVEMHIPNVPVLLNTAFISNSFNSDNNTKSLDEVSDDDVPLSKFINNDTCSKKIKVKLPFKKKKHISKKPIAFTPLILNNQDSFVPQINLHEQQSEQKVDGENSLNSKVESSEEIDESNNTTAEGDIPTLNENIQTSGTATEIEEKSSYNSVNNISDLHVEKVQEECTTEIDKDNEELQTDIKAVQEADIPSKDSNTSECKLLDEKEPTVVPEIPLLSQIIMTMEDEPLDNDLVNKSLVEVNMESTSVAKQTFQDTVLETTECNNKADYLDSGKENAEEKQPNAQVKRQRRNVKKSKIKRKPKLKSNSLNEGCNDENIQMNVSTNSEDTVIIKTESVKKKTTRTKNKVVPSQPNINGLDSSSKSDELTTAEGKTEVKRKSRSLAKNDGIVSQVVERATLEQSQEKKDTVLQNDSELLQIIESPSDSTSEVMIANEQPLSDCASLTSVVEITPLFDSRETPLSSLDTRDVEKNAEEQLTIEKDNSISILLENLENVEAEKTQIDSSIDTQFVEPNEVPGKKKQRKSRSRTKINKPDAQESENSTQLLEKANDKDDMIENIVQISDLLVLNNSKHKRKSQSKMKENKTLEESLEQKNVWSINQDNVIESVVRNEEASLVVDHIQQRRITRSKNRVKDITYESPLNLEKSTNIISESTCALSLANIIPLDILMDQVKDVQDVAENESNQPCQDLHSQEKENNSSQVDKETDLIMNELVINNNILENVPSIKNVQPPEDKIETPIEEQMEVLQEDTIQKSPKKRQSRTNKKLANAVTTVEANETKEEHFVQNELTESADELMKSIGLEINKVDSVMLENLKDESLSQETDVAIKKGRKKKSSRQKINASNIENVATSQIPTTSDESINHLISNKGDSVELTINTVIASNNATLEDTKDESLSEETEVSVKRGRKNKSSRHKINAQNVKNIATLQIQTTSDELNNHIISNKEIINDSVALTINKVIASNDATLDDTKDESLSEETEVATKKGRKNKPRHKINTSNIENVQTSQIQTTSDELISPLISNKEIISDSVELTINKVIENSDVTLEDIKDKSLREETEVSTKKGRKNKSRQRINASIIENDVISNKEIISDSVELTINKVIESNDVTLKDTKEESLSEETEVARKKSRKKKSSRQKINPPDIENIATSPIQSTCDELNNHIISNKEITRDSIALTINKVIESNDVTLDDTKDESFSEATEVATKKGRKKKSACHKNNASKIEHTATSQIQTTSDELTVNKTIESNFIALGSVLEESVVVNMVNERKKKKPLSAVAIFDTPIEDFSIGDEKIKKNILCSIKSIIAKDVVSLQTDEENVNTSENNICCKESNALEKDSVLPIDKENDTNGERPDIQMTKKKRCRKSRSTGLVSTANDNVTFGDESDHIETIDTNKPTEKKKRRSRSNRSEKIQIENISSEGIENTNSNAADSVNEELTKLKVAVLKLSDEIIETNEPFKIPQDENELLNNSEKRKNKKTRSAKQPIKLKIISPVDKLENRELVNLATEGEFKRRARMRNKINYAEVETDVSLDAPSITEEPAEVLESPELHNETIENPPKSKITLKITLDSTINIKTIAEPITETLKEENELNEKRKRRKSKNYVVNTSILDNTDTEVIALKSSDSEKKRKRRPTKCKEVLEDVTLGNDDKSDSIELAQLDVDEEKSLLEIASELKIIEPFKASEILLNVIESEPKNKLDINTDFLNENDPAKDAESLVSNFKFNLQMNIENEPDNSLMENKDIPEIMPDLSTLIEEVLPPTQLSDSEDEIPLAALAKGKKMQDTAIVTTDCPDFNSVPSDLKELDVSALSLGFKNDAIDVSEISVNSILKDIEATEKGLNKENSQLALQCSSFDFEDDNVINQEELSQFVNITNQTLLENIEKEDELMYNLNEENMPKNSSDLAEIPIIPLIEEKEDNEASDQITSIIEKTPDRASNAEEIFSFLKTPEIKSVTCDSDFITTPDLADTSLVIKIKNALNVKMKKPKKPRRRINKNAVKRKEDGESIHCEICNKVFKHKESLASHKRTLTHIAKLSEIEARENLANKGNDTAVTQQSNDNKQCVKEVENTATCIKNISSEIVNEDANISKAYDYIEIIDHEMNEGRQLPENLEGNIEPQNTVTNFMPGLINSANNTLKLIDIINEVLDKPVNDKNYSPRSIHKSPLSCDSTDTYMEPKRYKSLGERKSFDSDNYNLPCKNSDDRASSEGFSTTLKPISNGEILCKQLSILENIIEETNPTLKNYIDDSMSLSSNPFEEAISNQKLEDTQVHALSNLVKPTNHFHNFENISETFTKPVKQRNEDASKNKKKCSKENTTRKILNRDEELFVECCSLLKSGSEISGVSKKSTKQIPLNNFSRSNDSTWIMQKQQNSDRFIQRDSYSWLAQTSRVETPIGEPFSNNDWSNSNSAVSSEWLAQKAPSPDRPIESGTVNKKLNNNSGDVKYSNIQFEDISIASSLDTSKTLMAADNSNTENIRLDFHHIDFSNTNFNNEPSERRDFISDEPQLNTNEDSENVNDKESIPEDVSSKEEYDPEFKKKMVTAFGGLMAKALSKRLQAVVKKTKKSRGKRDFADALQASITDYAVPVKKNKLNQTDSDSNDCPKKMRTKGAMKVFEGLKVSIPTQDLNLKEVLNCSSKGKKEQDDESLLVNENNEVPNAEAEVVEEKVPKNGTVKNILKRFGNKLGLREKKKKNNKRRSPKSKNRSNNKPSTHDVYDFEESVDSNAVSNSNAFSLFKPKVQQQSVQEKCSNEAENWNAETDDSDTDRYYDSMSFEEMSLSSESINENNVESKPTKPVQKKNPEKTKDNQKKFMIMGRIFKNASKPKLEDKIPEIRDISSEENSKLIENYLDICNTVESVVKETEISTVPNNPAIITNNVNKLSKKEMDLLFDKLLEEEKKLENLAIESQTAVVEKSIVENDTVFNKPLAIEGHFFDKRKSKDKLKIASKTKKRQRHNSDSTSSDEFRLGGKQTKSTKKHHKTHRKSTKSKKETAINLEQEIKECIGVAGRKSQRKCTSGKQNVLVEFWSSDESSFEEITNSSESHNNQTTEIPPTEDRLKDSNPEVPIIKNTLDIYDFESDMESQIEEYHTKSKSDQCSKEADEESKLRLLKKISKPKRCRKQSKNLEEENAEDTEYEIECNRRRKLVENDGVVCTLPTGEKSKIDSLAVTRKKRNAGEQLYYWSSSSDDEFQDLIEVKPIREDTEDDRPMQHGWIVGDSPKKLVTMLAQAKGKKIDGETVKEQNNKKNRVTL